MILVASSDSLTLRTSVHEHLGNEASKEELVEAKSEAEAGPIVTELHNVEAVALEVNLASEVLFVESLHGDLVLAVVLGAVGFRMEVEVVLNRAARVLDLLVLSRRHGRRRSPVGNQDRQGGEDGEEDGGEEATADLASQIPRDEEHERDQEDIGEGVAASGIGRKRSIFNRRILDIAASVKRSCRARIFDFWEGKIY